MVINGSEVGKTGCLEDEYMMRDQPNDEGTKYGDCRSVDGGGGQIPRSAGELCMTGSIKTSLVKQLCCRSRNESPHRTSHSTIQVFASHISSLTIHNDDCPHAYNSTLNHPSPRPNHPKTAISQPRTNPPTCSQPHPNIPAPTSLSLQTLTCKFISVGWTLSSISVHTVKRGGRGGSGWMVYLRSSDTE
jgi:hypothetical protein